MKKFSKILVGILAVICLVEGFFLFRAYGFSDDSFFIARKVTRIEQIIDQYYKGSVDQEELEKDTYRGLVAGLGDPYSAYYSEEDFAELEESTSGVYYGVGISLTQNTKTGVITAVKTIKGSPAAGTGIKKGDILTQVDHHKVKNTESLDEVVKKIKGDEGTKVSLTFQRGSVVKTYSLTRKSVENQTVETKMLKNHIGYLAIEEFDEITVSQFESGLEKLKKQGAESLIIDLRDNPGGLLKSVTEIAAKILPKGTIVYTEDKNGNKQYYKDKDNEQLNMPLCVLTNGNSASASEILAGAIKDRGTGTLVGEKTFGKGIVQGFFDVGDGSYVKLTSASYYTPAGHNIHKKGIQPDVTVKDNEKTKTDEQLRRAVEILKKKK